MGPWMNELIDRWTDVDRQFLKLKHFHFMCDILKITMLLF